MPLHRTPVEASNDRSLGRNRWLDRPIPRPSHVLVRSRTLTAAVTALAVFTAFVAALEPDWLLAIDRPLADAIRGGSLEGFFRFWNRFGSQQDMIVAAAVLAVVLWRRCRPLAIAFPAALVVGVALDVAVKVLVDRPRPEDPLVGTALGSFPSGHALTGVIFFGLVSPAVLVLSRRATLFWVSVPLATVAAVLVAISRVYLGAHWPSDVMASAFIGAAALLGTEYVLGTSRARRHCDGCPVHGP